jgi:hypothetical protein
MKRVVEIEDIELQRIEGELSRLSGRMSENLHLLRSQLSDLDTHLAGELPEVEGELLRAQEHQLQNYEVHVARLQELSWCLMKLRTSSNQALVST